MVRGKRTNVRTYNWPLVAVGVSIRNPQNTQNTFPRHTEREDEEAPEEATLESVSKTRRRLNERRILHCAAWHYVADRAIGPPLLVDAVAFSERPRAMKLRNAITLCTCMKRRRDVFLFRRPQSGI